MWLRGLYQVLRFLKAGTATCAGVSFVISTVLLS